MTFLTIPFQTYVLAVLPVWAPYLVVVLSSLYLIIFRERFDPRTLIFWIAIVFLMPFLGTAFYLLFGCTLLSSREGRRRRSEAESFLCGDADPYLDADRPVAEVVSGAGSDIYTAGNDVASHWMVQDGIEATTHAVSDAQRSIHVEVNRLFSDTEWDRFLDVLTRKAREGIDVRLISSTLWFGRTPGLGKLKKAGVTFATFHGRVRSVFSLRSANRLLRDTIVIDSSRALIGVGSTVEIVGRAAERLECRFCADWFHSTGERLPVPDASVACGGCGVQIAPSGPDTIGNPSGHAYSAITVRARSRVVMALPTMAPDDEAYSVLRQAAISGKEVDLILPSRSRHRHQYWNSIAAVDRLVGPGIRVFITDVPIRTCTAVNDAGMFSHGSANFDTDTSREDYGLNIIAYSDMVASRMMADMDSVIAGSTEYDRMEHRDRPWGDRFRMAFSRILVRSR